MVSLMKKRIRIREKIGKFLSLRLLLSIPFSARFLFPRFIEMENGIKKEFILGNVKYTFWFIFTLFVLVSIALVSLYLGGLLAEIQAIIWWFVLAVSLFSILSLYLFLTVRKMKLSFSYVLFQIILSIIFFSVGVFWIYLRKFISHNVSLLYYAFTLFIFVSLYLIPSSSFGFSLLTSFLVLVVYILFSLSFFGYSYTFVLQEVVGILLVSFVSAFTNFRFERLLRSKRLTQLSFDEERKELEKEIYFLREDSITDHLTSLLNRRGLYEKFEVELKRAHRFSYPITVYVVDVDDFKKFNDDFGHLIGDKCLRVISEVLISYGRRSTDLVGRWGGEEFILVLSGVGYSRMEAEAIAEGIRREVQQITSEKLPRGATVSIGVVYGVPPEVISVDDVIKVADEAMYEVKKAGKNNFKIYSFDEVSSVLDRIKKKGGNEGQGKR